MMPKYRCGNGYGNQGHNLALLEILDTDKDMTVLIFSLEDFWINEFVIVYIPF